MYRHESTSRSGQYDELDIAVCVLAIEYYAYFMDWKLLHSIRTGLTYVHRILVTNSRSASTVSDTTPLPL